MLAVLKSIKKRAPIYYRPTPTAYKLRCYCTTI